MRARLLLVLSVFVLLLVLPELSSAQGMADPSALASQSLRGYTHMFIAYAIAWIMVLGWVISIARRLGRVEKALKD